MSDESSVQNLQKTPLHALHLELGARMVSFAGYHMPVQYPLGLMAEHLHTRQAAGLFDVSHMGQILFRGENAAQALEKIMPIDVCGLAVGQQRYGLLLNAQGGIIDDLMCVNRGQDILMVVNGACKAKDLAHIQAQIGSECEIIPLPDQALLALQGPLAVQVLSRLLPEVDALTFMTGCFCDWQSNAIYVTRSGYTGEDGFEISLAADVAEKFTRELLKHTEVQTIGLGARNSLRLEAGLCLYGQDMDETITPAQAGLNWAISKARRASGDRAGGFLGADVVLAELANLPMQKRKRVGLTALDRVPVREHIVLVNEQDQEVGTICSGLLSPTLNQPIAMAYLDASVLSQPIEEAALIYALVRGKKIPMQLTAMPFLPHRYHRLNRTNLA